MLLYVTLTYNVGMLRTKSPFLNLTICAALQAPLTRYDSILAYNKLFLAPFIAVYGLIRVLSLIWLYSKSILDGKLASMISVPTSTDCY
jgi:hypothetical protein